MCNKSPLVDKNGISFERHVYRKNHNHDDLETLQIVIDEEKTGRKKGEFACRDDSHVPTERTGYDMFYIEFGSKKVDY